MCFINRRMRTALTARWIFRARFLSGMVPNEASSFFRNSLGCLGFAPKSGRLNLQTAALHAFDRALEARGDLSIRRGTN